MRKENGNLRKQLQTSAGMLKRLPLMEIILHRGGAVFWPARRGGRWRHPSSFPRQAPNHRAVVSSGTACKPAVAGRGPQ